MFRKPAVAGYFYQEYPENLTNQVKKYVDVDITIEKTRALGIVAPHAGFVYSGAVAGALYSRIILPESIILIGPNHTGMGAPVSIFSEGTWEMPNGAVEVDSQLAKSIIENSKYARQDYNAHTGEHSLEVQIPFIQFFTVDFKIVPVTMMSTDLEVCKDIGHAIASTIQETKRDALIVASSDMTHYESSSAAREKDQKAIDKILGMDPAGLHSVIRKNNITMCGFAPAVTMLYAAIELGASKAALVKYMNSGDVSGDYGQVVGYAGIIIS